MKDSIFDAAKGILDSYLEMNNHRKTPERYTILKAVYSTKGHFTLDAIGEKLVKELNFPVSRATLYNTMNLFMELRLVVRHRFNGATVYEACYDNESHSHQICTFCGKVTEVMSQEIDQAIADIHLKRFRKDGYTLYIYGVCSSCLARLKKQQNREQSRKTDKERENRKKTEQI